MTHPLSGCRARQRRAAFLFNIIKDELDSLPREAKAVNFRSVFDETGNEIIVYIENVPDFPSRWGLMASEAFFNARAALDYLAWELGCWNLRKQGKASEEPHKRTYFPITTSPEQFKRQHGQVSALDPEHIARIESLQPYRDKVFSMFPALILPGTEEAHARKTPLARLKRVNDHDKHRFLRPVGTSSYAATKGDATAVDCDVIRAEHNAIGILRAGDQWSAYHVIPTGVSPRIEVRDWVIPDIAFGDFNLIAGFPGVFRAVHDAIDTFSDVFGPEP